MFVVPPSGDTPENLCLKGTLLQSFRNIDTRETECKRSLHQSEVLADCRGKGEATLVCISCEANARLHYEANARLHS